MTAVRTRDRLYGQRVPAALLVLSGVAVGVGWRVLVPFFQHHSDPQEAVFASEGCLAALCALAGLATGLMVAFMPGRFGAARTAVAIAGSIAAGLLAWATGAAFDAPVLTSPGIILIWAVVTAVVIFIGALLLPKSDAEPLDEPGALMPAPAAGWRTGQEDQ